MGFINLPIDVILLLGTYLKYTDDLNALCCTSRALHGMLSPTLHKRTVASGNGGYILEWAARRGLVSTARLILQAGAAPSACGSEQWQPLALAAIDGHIEIMKLLLEHGIDPGSISNNWYNHNWKKPSFYPFEDAEEAEFSKSFQSEGHPLSLAASRGQVCVVNLLLQHGVPPDLRSIGEEKHTALHLAAREGHIHIVRILVEAKSPIDVQTETDYTPLAFAASKGHLEIVRFLLKRGANPNIPSSNGYTLLSIASTSGNIEIVRCLLNHGANLTPSFCQNPCYIKEPIYQISLAAERGFDEVVDLLLRKHDFIESSTKTHQQVILFCIAAMTGRINLLTDLIRKHNYDPNLALDPRFPILCTHPSNFLAERPIAAISWAATYNQVTAIKVLIANDASITPANGDSPLICAIQRGHKDVVETLLAHGADPNEIPGRALKIAVSNPPIFSLLLSHVVDLTNALQNVNISDEIIHSGQVNTLRILLDHAEGPELFANDVYPYSDTANCEETAIKVFKFALGGGEEIFRLLLSRGLIAIPKEPIGFPATVIFKSAMRLGDSIVRLLFDMGFRVNVGKMELIWDCANSNHADGLLDVFLQNGCGIDDQDTIPTALYAAAELGYERPIRPLLKKGANVQFVCRGETPLSVAAKGKHLHAVRLILQAFDERDLSLIQVESMLKQAEKYALEEDQVDILKAIDQFRCRRLYPVPSSS